MTDRIGRWLRVGQAVIVAGATILLALIWADTAAIVGAEQKFAISRAEALVRDRALLFAAELDRQLAAVDQTLRIMADEWSRDPVGFSVENWRRRAALLAGTSAIFRTDARGVVAEASLQSLVGRDIKGTEPFRDASTAAPSTDRLLIGRAALGPITQEWQVSMLRPLRDASERFAGTIGIVDRIGLLTADFTIADLGPQSLAAVIGTNDGRVRATLGPASGPPDISLADSGLFAALRDASSGIWHGKARPRGTDRIYAFRSVSSQPLSLIVGVERTQALGSAAKPIRAAVHFAIAMTVLVLLIAVMLMIALQFAVRRERRLRRDRAALAQANTELQEARQSADHKATQLQAVITGMSDGVLMLDAALRVASWNQQFVELSGIPPGLPTTGMSMEQVLRAQAEAGEFGHVDVETEVARRMSLLRSGVAIGTLQRSRPDGRIVELHRNPVPGGGFVTLISDITARKLAENALRQAHAAAEATTASKARFAAMVSHEIRAPLHALLNTLNLMSESCGSGTQPALLGSARCCSKALLALIDDILDLSRIEAGQLTLRPSRFLLRPLLNDLVEMLRPEAACLGLRIGLSVADAVPSTLNADPGRLRQVLTNLLSNALKYAQPGEVELRVEMQSANRLGWLHLSVLDPGPAIPPVQYEHLFEPFAQLEHGSATGPGWGLGLAICRHLVASMGGEIGCRTARSNGNEFWVTLPLLADRESRESAASDSGVPRTRLLLVEDVPASRLTTVLLLRGEGHLVTGVADADAALQELARAPYDVVLVDMHLPRVGGVELCRLIRAIPGPNQQVILIGLTGDETAPARAAGLDAGMAAVLQKGLRGAEWRDVILHHVWRVRDHARAIAPPPRDDCPVVDEARLGELLATAGVGRFAGLTEDCVRDLSALLTELRCAEAGGDDTAMAAAIHAMAGLAANYGLVALVERLRQRPDAQEIAKDIARASEALRCAARTEMV